MFPVTSARGLSWARRSRASPAASRTVKATWRLIWRTCRWRSTRWQIQAPSSAFTTAKNTTNPWRSFAGQTKHQFVWNAWSGSTDTMWSSHWRWRARVSGWGKFFYISLWISIVMNNFWCICVHLLSSQSQICETKTKFLQMIHARNGKFEEIQNSVDLSKVIVSF